MTDKWLKYAERKYFASSFILDIKIQKIVTCLCGWVVFKTHSPTLILTCLWMSKGVLTKSLGGLLRGGDGIFAPSVQKLYGNIKKKILGDGGHVPDPAPAPDPPAMTRFGRWRHGSRSTLPDPVVLPRNVHFRFYLIGAIAAAHQSHRVKSATESFDKRFSSCHFSSAISLFNCCSGER